MSDGYVTGLEPGTDFPNAKPFERSQGRVMTLPAGGSYDSELMVEIADNPAAVTRLHEEIAVLQKQAAPQIDREVPANWAPTS